MPRQVDWICCQPTPYNDVLFGAIARQPGIQLTVHFTTPGLQSHPWSSSLASGYDRRFYDRRFGLDWELLRRASQTASVIVSGGWNEPTILAVLARRLANGGPYAIWTDTPRPDGSGSALKRTVRRRALRTILSRAAAAFGTGSPAVELLKCMGSDPGKTHNLPYFVDLSQFGPRQVETDRRKGLTLLSAGRLDFKLKGHDVAIRAIGQASKSTDAALTYRIAGSGPDESRLRQLAADEGVALEIVGWLEPDQLPAFYQSGDALLHPSRYEPYGVAILEAMASALPVLASDVCGAARDRIVHGESGLLHRAGDSNQLAEHVAQLATRAPEIHRMGAAARLIAEQWPASRGAQLLGQVVAEC